MNVSIHSDPPLNRSTGGAQGEDIHLGYQTLQARWQLSPAIATNALKSQVQLGFEKTTATIDYHQLVSLLGEAVRDPSPFGRWVFDQGAALLTSIRPDPSVIDNNEWTHAALYLFRASCFSPQPGRSILDHPESHRLAADLVQTGVTRSDLSSSVGTLPVLIKGMIASNIRAWGSSRDISSFYFRPPCVQSPRFVELLQRVVDGEVAELSKRQGPAGALPVIGPCAVALQFCTARTPTEFLRWALQQRVGLPAKDAANTLSSMLSDDAGNLSQRHHNSSTESSSASLVLPPRPSSASVSVPAGCVRRGIYVDVFGTLVGDDHLPNLRLVQIVQDLMEHHRAVYLVSDSAQDDLRRVLGPLSKNLPPVLAKESLQGVEVEWLIDNNDPSAQGLRARHFLNPQQAVLFGRQLVDDDTLYMAG